jgi:hypothetical protein
MAKSQFSRQNSESVTLERLLKLEQVMAEEVRELEKRL